MVSRLRGDAALSHPPEPQPLGKRGCRTALRASRISHSVMMYGSLSRPPPSRLTTWRHTASLCPDAGAAPWLRQRASPHTVANSRDTFSRLVRDARQRLGQAPSALTLDDPDAPVIGSCLDDLEHERGSSTRRRHVRLTAIDAFLHDAAWRAPIKSCLAIERSARQ